MSAWLDIATITKTSKSKGGFAAKAAAGLPFLLQPGARVHLVPPVLDAPRVVDVVALSGLQGDAATVRFDVEAGEELVGCHCLVDADDARALAASLGEELGFAAGSSGFAGWTLCDADGVRVGTVVDCVEHPAQLTLTVQLPDGSQRLVPLVDELLIALDEQERCLRVALPTGILEL